MMIIRRQQITAIESAAWQRMVPLLEKYARERFPARCDAMPAGALRELIDVAHRECSAAGLQSAAAMACWLDLLLTYGASCTRDGTLPWLATLLRDTAGQREQVRVDCLRLAAESWRGAMPLEPPP